MLLNLFAGLVSGFLALLVAFIVGLEFCSMLMLYSGFGTGGFLGAYWLSNSKIRYIFQCTAHENDISSDSVSSKLEVSEF